MRAFFMKIRGFYFREMSSLLIDFCRNTKNDSLFKSYVEIKKVTDLVTAKKAKK